MTDHHVTDLLERATADLSAGPDLVAGAVVDGRRRRRRRLVGTAAATVAVLGLTGTGLTIVLSGSDGGGRAIDPAATSGPQPTTAAPSPVPIPAYLAVTAAQVADAFASVVPGTITKVPNKEMDDRNPIVDFLWNGYAVRVGVVSDTYVSGQRVPDPKQRCEQFGSGFGCTPGRVPGSFEQTNTATGPAVDGGVTVRFATVYFAEGWDVSVAMANAADTKDSQVLSPDVPLTMDQLLDVAYSDVWLE